MAQWFLFKEAHPDALVFFRMGDFYELFFADAEAAAGPLGVALTARGEHGGRPIPMCGVPVHAADAYLARLIRGGFRVAIVEQMEKGPSEGGAKRSAKLPLARSVVRLVTPGTLTEEALLDGGRPSLLLAVASDGAGALGLAILDVAGGAVETEACTPTRLAEALARIDPAEILAPDTLPLGALAGRRAPAPLAVAPASARARAAQAFGAASLDAFGTFSDAEAVALAVALDYVRLTGAGTWPRLAPPAARGQAGFLGIDAATRASLDLVRARDGSEDHTLIAAVRRTLTPQGGRLLAHRLACPLDDLAAIGARQEAWSQLARAPTLAAALRTTLRHVPDAARALGRVGAGRATPRDLGAIRDALAAAHSIGAALADAGAPLDVLAPRLRSGEALRIRLADMLTPAPPLRLDDGGAIADGVDAALDAARGLARDSRQVVAALQGELSTRYAVPQLKIRHHAQLGYVIEVPQAAVEALRARPELTLRQGMANGARFTSAPLAELDERIVRAADDALTRERDLFAQLLEAVLAHAGLPAIADALAALDVTQGSARLASERGWCRPALTDDTSFHLTGSRHPVVEAALPPGMRFTPNECDLAPSQRLMLLTGPNMAGKSTYLRQAALSVVLAQSGLPVPAAEARIGLVDRLFSRVGAADDLARGRSTFMVEMIETASILHAATARSLVVVDEIGRGTSTLDGLAIATAVLEQLHTEIGCRGIFATHFHELAEHAASLPRVALRTMRVRDWRGEVVFQHEVVAGAAGRSWGVHVARLAGVPPQVVMRARTVLAELERVGRGRPESLPLFAAASRDKPAPDPVRETLLALDLDAITPRDAHEALRRLRSLIVTPQDDLSDEAVTR